jgi:hypothetical protein
MGRRPAPAPIAHEAPQPFDSEPLPGCDDLEEMNVFKGCARPNPIQPNCQGELHCD